MPTPTFPAPFFAHSRPSCLLGGSFLSLLNHGARPAAAPSGGRRHRCAARGTVSARLVRRRACFRSLGRACQCQGRRAQCPLGLAAPAMIAVGGAAPPTPPAALTPPSSPCPLPPQELSLPARCKTVPVSAMGTPRKWWAGRVLGHRHPAVCRCRCHCRSRHRHCHLTALAPLQTLPNSPDLLLILQRRQAPLSQLGTAGFPHPEAVPSLPCRRRRASQNRTPLCHPSAPPRRLPQLP